MPVYLDEEMVGEDRNEINYPHLLLCAGVTVQLSNGRLIGGHVTNGASEPVILAEIKRLVNLDPGKPVFLYVIANLAEQQRHQGKNPLQKAQALGFTESTKVIVYDTQRLNPDDGSFARLVSTGGTAKCTVWAVKDQAVRPYVFTSGKNKGAEAKAMNIRKYNKEMNTWGGPPVSMKKGIQGALPAPLQQPDFQSI